MRFVIVSDNDVIPEFVARPLIPLGHEVVTIASTGELETPELKADIIIAPRQLPGANIETFAQWMRTTHPQSHLVMLGLDADDRSLATDLGLAGYLEVPFSDADVLELIGATGREQKLVLLADDSQMIHKHTTPILEAAGYEVMSAFDGAEALKVLRERQPDLIITDVEMPKLDGFELCKTIKESPDTGHIPVLISSSLGETHDLERGFDAGADDYLVKPVIPEELLTRVKQLLSSTMPGSRERILVVDDSPAQRHYVADCLSRQGFEVFSAENGRIGLERAREVSPALVISDYEMPEMTGFELVHALKGDPATRNIPVIMLTARDSQRDMAQMRAAGASSYLVKPFAQDKCIATVERTLAERRLLAYKQASSLYISEGARKAAEQRAAHGDIAAVRADERDMSVLFSDLVGFTGLSQQLTPRQVIELLNAYFDVMCPIVVDHGGDIDKFIGDAIMAVFDDAPGQERAAVRAVRAALAMQRAMPEFNAARTVSLEMRIGINTGPLVRGDLGSRVVRRDYTVIGDTVNRAQRYESNCPRGAVLVSESTMLALGDTATVEAMDGLNLKGVETPVRAYIVRDVAEQGAEGSQ